MIKLTNLGKWLTKSFGYKRIFIKSDDRTIRLNIKPYQQIILVFCLIISGIWIVLSTSFLSINQSFSKESVKNDILTTNSYQDRLNSLAKERNKKEIEAAQILQQFYMAISEISKDQSVALETRKKNEELENKTEIPETEQIEKNIKTFRPDVGLSSIHYLNLINKKSPKFIKKYKVLEKNLLKKIN